MLPYPGQACAKPGTTEGAEFVPGLLINRELNTQQAPLKDKILPKGHPESGGGNPIET